MGLTRAALSAWRLSMAMMLVSIVAGCSAIGGDISPRFSQLQSEMERASFSSNLSRQNALRWAKDIDDRLEYGYNLFYSHTEQSWVLAARDNQFDLFDFGNLDINQVHSRLSLPGRGDDGSNSGFGNPNSVRVSPLAGQKGIERVFSDGSSRTLSLLRFPLDGFSDVPKVMKDLRILIASERQSAN